MGKVAYYSFPERKLTYSDLLCVFDLTVQNTKMLIGPHRKQRKAANLLLWETGNLFSHFWLRNLKIWLAKLTEAFLPENGFIYVII